jgi:hypothetical protein
MNYQRSRDVRRAFRAHWAFFCAEDPIYRTDVAAMREAFCVFVDGLRRDRLISDRLARIVTLGDSSKGASMAAEFPGAPVAGARLIPARDVREGDTIVFRASFANYTVDETDTDSLGRVRHHHGHGAASSCYAPGELLWVVRGGEA